MITSIQRVKGLGVFHDFTVASELPAFGRFNVIYGENGAGKTTLSRLFHALEKGAHAEYPELDFTVAIEGGTLKAGQQYARKVRVFNSDYVELNIGQFQGPIKHILIVGEENKALAAEIRTEQSTHDARVKQIESTTAEARRLEAAKGKVFTAIASTISEATSGSTARTYRKPNAEQAFDKVVNPKTLDDNTLTAHRATVRQEQMEPIAPFAIPSIRLVSGETQQLPAAVATSLTFLNTLTKKSAQSSALRRLLEAPDISMWVEDGLRLHHKHDSKHCEFCDQSLPPERLARLTEHFSVEDQNLKMEIEALLAIIAIARERAIQITLPDRAALYSELRPAFETACSQLQAAIAALVGALDEGRTALHQKLTLRTTSYSNELSYDPSPFETAVSALTLVLEQQHAKTSAFETVRIKSVAAIETHYLATIATEVMELKTKIEGENAKIKKLTDGAPDLADPRGIKELAESIAQKQTRVSSAHAGGAELTDHLKKFLGRTDLRFENSAEGYVVLRRDKEAKRLSEGEKTAIAFIHFIVQLGDQDFDPKEGIVVIDDPVSSLDASAIYQAFSFLKNAVKDAKQIFILTHNFEFLKLLLPWAKRGFRKAARYYMLVCVENQQTRDATIRTLDDLLINHSSEYQYLFKTLHQFKSDGTIMSCYHVPNMARKVLETFLEFYVPSNDDIYNRLENLKFDPHKKTAIYKFTNDQSHATGKGFDPALVAETQKNAKYLLEMIEAVAPDHYAGLVAISA